MIEERDAIGATTATYVYGRYIDEVLTMRRDTDDNGTPEDYYYHADHIWNVTTITDSAGQVVERYEYGKMAHYGTNLWEAVKKIAAAGPE